MWARRCGAPPGWPSRVKVTFFSAFSGTLGLSIYMYMAGSNMSYLDLERPTEDDVLCLLHWPLRRHRISWADPQESVATFFDAGGPEEWATAYRYQCSTAGMAVQKCADVVIPVAQMKRPLALAMGQSYDKGIDVLGVWAKFFLLLTFAIWLGVTTHDLALIGRRKKHFILDVSGINEHCPSIRRIWRSMAGLLVLRRLVTQDNLSLRIIGIVIAVALAPVLIAWNLVLFNFFIVPLILLAFVRYPIRMSRAWVFISCVACFLYGLGLSFQQLAFVADTDFRPRYAVTWTPEEMLTAVGGPGANATLLAELGQVQCTCGCDYPVSFSVCVNLLIIGVLTAIKSAFLAFRCLKGLRRSQWANLLSVMFPVPITMYSVDWRLPSGQPIKFRTEGVPVQAEVAFDPFAMMDEQLDSASTTIHLKPEPVHRYSYNASSGELDLVEPQRHLEMPALPMPAFRPTDLQVRKVEYIGCCGFPWPTGGQQFVYDPDFVAQLEEGGGDGDGDAEGDGEGGSVAAGDVDLAVPCEGREDLVSPNPNDEKEDEGENDAGQRDCLVADAAAAGLGLGRVEPGLSCPRLGLTSPTGSTRLPPVVLKRL